MPTVLESIAKGELSEAEITRRHMKLECAGLAYRIHAGDNYSAQVGGTTAQAKAKLVLVTAAEIYDWVTA